MYVPLMTTSWLPLPRWLLRAGIAAADSPRDIAGKTAMNLVLLLGVPFVALPYGLAGLQWGLPNYLTYAAIVAVWHSGLLAVAVWTSSQPDPNRVHRLLSRVAPLGTIVLYVPVTTWLLGPGRNAGFPQIWAFLTVPFVFLVYDNLRESWLILGFSIAAIIFQERVIIPHTEFVPIGPVAFVETMRMFNWFAFTIVFGYVLALHRREMDQAMQSMQTESAARGALVESLREANARAEAAVAAKGEFLASMSHEIRTPMHAIVGMSNLALASDLSPRQRGYMERIQSAGTHLVDLVSNLLDHSRFEANGLALDAVDFDVDDVLTNLVNVTGVLARKQGIELVVHVAPDVPTHLRGDPLRLGQVLINLTANAIKFTTAGEVVVTIRVATRTRAQITLDLRVQDTGIGMSEETRAQLFQAFTQADASIPRRFGGSGLGLSIARRLVRAMGGTLTAESREGVGSLFQCAITLDAPKGFLTHSDLPAPYATALVLDDNLRAAEALAAALAAFGVKATVVQRGADAKTAIETHRFDWVFVDELLDGEDGWAVVRHLKSDLSMAETPIVLLTTAEVLLPPEALDEAGVQLTLEKPLQRAAVATLLDGVHPQHRR